MALAYGPDGPNGPNGQDGRATVYPGGLRCRSEVWLGAELPQGVCGQCDGNGGARAKDVPGVMQAVFNGNGGLRGAGAWRLLMDQVDLMDLMDNVGAPWDT